MDCCCCGVGADIMLACVGVGCGCVVDVVDGGVVLVGSRSKN